MRLIGERIRSVRGRMTQEAFAIALSGERSVGRVAVANYEAGRRLPNNELLQRIAELGKTTVNWLLVGEAGQVPAEHGSLPRDRQAVFDAEKLRSLAGSKLRGRITLSDDELALVELLRFADDRQVIKLARVCADANAASEFGPFFATQFRAQLARLKRMETAGRYEKGEDYDDLKEVIGLAAKFSSGKYRAHQAKASRVRRRKPIQKEGR